MRHREGAPDRSMLPRAISCCAKVCRHRTLGATVALGAQKRGPDHMEWRDDNLRRGRRMCCVGEVRSGCPLLLAGVAIEEITALAHAVMPSSARGLKAALSFGRGPHVLRYSRAEQPSNVCLLSLWGGSASFLTDRACFMARQSNGTGPDGYQHKLLLSLSHQVASGSRDAPSPLPRKRRGVDAGAQSLQILLWCYSRWL